MHAVGEEALSGVAAMSQALTIDAVSLESLVAHLSEEFMERLKRGESPSIEEYLARHPEHAAVIRNVLTSLQFMHLAGAESLGIEEAQQTTSPSQSTLGDYRIIREVGRGGMGVVYEAEQLSLGRRVALKVLPFASALDDRQLQRFKNEAHAAAQLHHTNIVPVYAVGCERGVHYYAMQHIAGQTLAAVIQDLRKPRVTAQQATANENQEWRMKSEETKTKHEELASADAALVSTFDILHSSFPTLSDERSTKSPAFFRTVANLAIQATEALEHAHELGVIHRDVKPANLIVDARGKLWVTDFGLAQIQGETKLTMTGDLLGTLRYMSPEQAQAKRAIVDHRSDIYSLGATLYELMTLEPAFASEDRQELLRQIAFEEPRPLRRVNPAIPAELETIVLKMMEKNPTDRYTTAHEVAEDLRRFLEDKPIRARRPSTLARFRKWSWRHRSMVTAAAISAVIVFAASSGIIAWKWREAESRRWQAEEAESNAEKRRLDAERSRDEARKSAAREQAINKFFLDDLLGAASPEEQRGRKQTVEEVLDLAAKKIDGAFPDQPEVEARVRDAIGTTYRDLGLVKKAEPFLRRALEIQQHVLGEDKRDTLETMIHLGQVLGETNRFPDAEAILQKAVMAARRVLGDEDPTTLDLLHMLAYVAGCRGRLGEAESLGRQCLDIKLRVLGPEHVETLVTMGNLAGHVLQRGRWPEAETLVRDRMRIALRALPKDHPGTLQAKLDLFVVLLYEGKVLELEALARENLDAAIRVWGPNHRKRWSVANQLAQALYCQGKFKEAEQLTRESVEFLRRTYGGEGPTVEECLGTLGLVLRAEGRWSEAEATLRDVVKLRSRAFGPEHPRTLHQLCFLGTVLQASGKRAQAGAALRAALDARRKVVPFSPDLAESLYVWAEYLLEEGDMRQSDAALREALEIQRQVLPRRHRDVGQTLAALGWALTEQGRAKDGEPLLREGLEICRTGYPFGHWITMDAQTKLDWATATAESRLGGCLTALGQFAEAENLLLSSYQTLQSASGTPPHGRLKAVDRVINLYETWGKPEKASAWQSKHAMGTPPGSTIGCPMPCHGESSLTHRRNGVAPDSTCLCDFSSRCTRSKSPRRGHGQLIVPHGHVVTGDASDERHRDAVLF
jgi:serine/threonine protein kinase